MAYFQIWLMFFLNRKNVVNISTIHNNPFEDYPMTFGKCKGNLLARLHCFLFRKLIDIFCSESVSMDLKERTNLTPLSIRNGVWIEVNI